MILVNMKASALLIREEGFNLETAAVVFAGLVAIGQTCYQIERPIVADAPPANQSYKDACFLREPNFMALEKLPFLQGISANRLTLRTVLHINLRRSSQNVVPVVLFLNPLLHFGRIIFGITQQNHLTIGWQK